jgi:Tfp pilus assembly protein PilF
VLRYQSFRLQIVPGAEGGYAVQAFSPCGEGRASFIPPEAGGPPEAMGERLFRAAFQGEIRALYERSRELLSSQPDAGLRIELMLDPRDSGLVALQALPWELMRQPGTPEFLALSRRSPVVRYLAVPRSVPALHPPKVLRILAVGTSPRDQPRLNLDRELRNLRDAVGASTAIQIVEPKARTLAALREALLDHECHVLHFMGHGDASAGKEGVLLFETEGGVSEPVRGQDLMNKLADRSTLRLIVLNACESASVPSPPPEAFDPLAGVAVSLVMGGMPAVVAMQEPISDTAAIAFSRAFYQRLAAGDPVDAAVAEGRQAVHSQHLSGFEWATPALFLRTPNGEIEPPPDRTRRQRIVWRIAWAGSIALLLGLIGFAAYSLRVHYLLDRGVDFAQHGQWPEAHKEFVAAVWWAPLSAEVRSNLAGAQEKRGYLTSAETNYRAAVRLEPESAEHLYNLGHFLNGQMRYQEAYLYLQSAVQRSPTRVDAYGELAAAAFHLKLLDEARENLTKALKLDPARPALFLRLGEVELAAKQPEAAIRSLKEAKRLTPLGDRRRIETTWLLIQAYDTLKDRASTCQEIAEFRRLDAVATPWAPQVEEAAERNRCKP